jgi:eukaryotic-like serine/threonine-protein kinase
MPDGKAKETATLPLPQLMIIDNLCAKLEKQWKSPEKPRIEDYLNQAESSLKDILFQQLLEVEIEYRRRENTAARPEDYDNRFPQFREFIRAVFAKRASVQDAEATNDWQASAGKDAETISQIDYLPHSAQSAGVLQPDAAGARKKLGRYELSAVLGKGAFGTVYLGNDAELDRQVAVKLLDTQQFSSQDVFESLQRDARIL